MVRLGHINYLNCLPVHGAILMKRVPFEGKLVWGVPSTLNRLLEEGEVDVSPSSSVELLKGYKILPGFSISGKEKVKSIILVTKKPLETIKEGLFYVTSHSATSVLLLKIILKQFFFIEARYETFNPENHTLDELIMKADGVLFIGDSALNLKTDKTHIVNDLASLWYKNTGLPFTFALWQIRKGFSDNEEIKTLHRTLLKSYRFYKENPLVVAEYFSSQFGMDAKKILNYWNSLSFELNIRHLNSLNLFFSLAMKQGIINQIPSLNFADL